MVVSIGSVLCLLINSSCPHIGTDSRLQYIRIFVWFYSLCQPRNYFCHDDCNLHVVDSTTCHQHPSSTVYISMYILKHSHVSSCCGNNSVVSTVWTCLDAEEVCISCHQPVGMGSWICASSIWWDTQERSMAQRCPEIKQQSSTTSRRSLELIFHVN